MCVVTFVVACFSGANHKSEIAKAENNVQQTLISKDISNEDFINVYGGSNINELSSFTPFDEENESRMAGKSIVPAVSDNNKIIGAKYNLLSNGGLDISADRLSFGMWVYFSTTDLHDLSIKVSVDSDNYFETTITKTELFSILQKNEEYEEPGFGWNYLELPIMNSRVTGSIKDNNGKCKEFVELEINYHSEQVLQNIPYAGLKFFGLEIIESTSDLNRAIIKQDYAIFSFKFWDEDVLSNLVRGDSLSVPTLASAVKYAWYGELNLLLTQNISWRVIVAFPNKADQTFNMTGSDNIVFDEQGIYTVTFRAYRDDGNNIIDLFDNVKINVLSDKLVYPAFKNYRITTETTKKIQFHISPLLDKNSIQVLSISSNNNAVEIRETQKLGEYEISSTKACDAVITIKILAKRNTNSSEAKEYVATVNIKVDHVEDNRQVQKIIIWVVISIILSVWVIILIKSVVNSRKNDVK